MAQPPWTQFLSWVALALFILVALLNVSGYPFAWWFALPVGLAIVALVIGIRARKRLDIVLSALIVVAIPLWFLADVFLLSFMRLANNSFSP